MNTPEDLSKLSDAEINALVAERVAGWTDFVPSDCNPEFGYLKTATPPNWGDYGTRYHCVPDYLHDANAVIELLEKCPHWQADKCPHWKADFRQDGYWVLVETPIYAHEWAKTFCKAACLALLSAHRTQEGRP